MINFVKIKYLNNKETIHNFFWRGLQTFSKQGITFLIFIICAKLLSPYQFGVYNYILAVVFFLIIFGDFGISTATSKYVAEYNISNKEKLKLILFNSLLIIFSLSTIMIVLTLLFGKNFLGDNYVYVLYTLPLLFLIPITSLYDGVYRGLKEFKKLALISTVIGIFSIPLVFILMQKFGLIGALISQNLFYLFLFISLSLEHKNFSFKLDTKLIKEISKYSILVGLANVGYFLYTRVDIIILGQFGFIEEIGYYEIINKIFQILILPVMILATVVAPNSTKNIVFKKYDYMRKKLLKNSFSLFLAGIFVAFFCYLTLPFVFKIFLSEYDPSLLVKILSLMLILFPFKVVSTYLNIGFITPSGLVKILTMSTLLLGIVNIFLDYYLIYHFGFIGVIYATLIVQFIFVAVNFIYFKKIIKKIEI